jgi:hypothetical protein
MGLLGVARANTAVGVSPETFLLLLLQCTVIMVPNDQDLGRQRENRQVNLRVVTI